MNLREYGIFVLNKAAGPRPIGADDFNLMHVALGLSTEYLELLFSYSREHTQEELGDLLWYLSLGAQQLGEDLSPPENIERGKTLTRDTLGVFIETFVSLVKKEVIYGTPVVDLNIPFMELWRAYNEHLSACGVTLDELITSNVEKLSMRYKESFTPEESLSREDKQ